MSINKKALTRYLAYDSCLRNRGRRYTWRDLVDVANNALAEEGLEGIGKTQFYADIKYMELSEWKAPIEKYKEGRIVYYRYEDPHYSISGQPLSETETSQLHAAIQVLSRFKGMPQFEWVNEIIPTIQTKLGLIETGREIIGFDSNFDYEGLQYFTPIFNAIVNKRVLQVSYQDFKSAIAYDVELHPYYLKQHNSRWFVLGFNPVQEIQNWIMALDRIKAIEETSNEYRDSDMDWDDYFADFIGVSKIGTEEVEVKLLIQDAEQAAYIRTKPLHQTQKPIKEASNGFETSIKVIPNYELEKLLLSFGERIQVISPESLRRKIAQRLSQASELYSL